MNVERMAYRPGYYAIALKQEQRRKAEKTLVCPSCGRQNKPGASDIDIDEHDDARCPCGYVWQVRIDGI